MLSFVEQVKLKNNNLVMSYSGVSESGIQFFAYILCTAPQVKMLKADLASRTARNITEYGQVLFIDTSSAAPTAKSAQFLENWCAANGGNIL